MKHNVKITLILLSMFIVTQFIGLYVVNYYSPVQYIDGKLVEVDAPSLPFGMQSPEISSPFSAGIQIFIAFVIAISLLIILSKFDASFILKLWFFVVVMISLSITLLTVISGIKYATIIALIVAIPLAFFKVYKRSFLVHNATELFIYPGIAAVFVGVISQWAPLINLALISIILILISIYDMWAVWHSGIMQKMAKYQMNTLKVFSGFLIPYLDKKEKDKLKKMKAEKKNLKGKKIRANVAILGGGDVIFPIITAGVVLRSFGLIPALFVVFGATLGLAYLFFLAKKRKFYPAMPFISAGIFLGMILSWFLF